MFDRVTSLLSQRFVLGLVMPLLAFLTGVGALVATLNGWNRTLSWWARLDASRRTLLIVAFICALIILATFLGTQLMALTRLLEGYWSAVARPLAAWGSQRERARRSGLEQDSAPSADLRLYQEFPYVGELLPTRLGNALLASEVYSGDEERWSLDAVFWWPRLCLVLPDTVGQAVDAARATLDQLVVLTWLATLFALVSAGFGAAGVPLTVWLPCVGGALLLARLSYLAAVSAAANFGEQVRSCFDLYRKPLLEALGWPVPEAWVEERELWKNLQEQLYRRSASTPVVLMRPRRVDDGTGKPTPPAGSAE